MRKTVFVVWNPKDINPFGGLFSTKELARERKVWLNQNNLCGDWHVSERVIDYYVEENLTLDSWTLD